MKSLTRSLIALALVMALTPVGSHAQNLPAPPGQISYQGYVTDANGFPLATNNPINYTVNFGIWDSPQGGSNLWLEQQVVTIDRGYFTVLLGNGSSIGGFWTNNLTSIFSGANAGNRYLELTVLGLATGDPPIAPRLRFLASPYSLLASQALGVAGTNSVPDTSLSPNIALRANGNTFSGPQYLTAAAAGSLNFDNTYQILAKNSGGTYETFLWPRYADNVTYLNYGSVGFNIRNNTNATTMFMANNGNVGIGSSFSQSSLPAAPLSFASLLGEKISLWNSGGGVGYGLGVQGNQLQIHADTSSSDIVFGYGGSTNLTETMRIKGNGNVGIGVSNPGVKLQVGGGGLFSGDVYMFGGTDGIGVFASGSIEDLRIVRGTVKNDGTIVNGRNFSVTKTGTGAYTITFIPAFADAPVVTITPSQGLAPVTATWNNLLSGSVAVQIYGGGSPSDGVWFNFIAIGAR